MENELHALVICVIFLFCFSFFLMIQRRILQIPFWFFWSIIWLSSISLKHPHTTLFFFLDGAQCIFGVVGEFPRIFFFFWPVTMTFRRNTRRKNQCVISSPCFFEQGGCNIERPIRSHWNWALRVMNQTRPDHQMAHYCSFGADTLKRLVDELKLVKGAAVSNGRWGKSSAWENISGMPNILQIGVTCPYLSNCGNEGGGITCALRLLVLSFPKWIEEPFFFITVGSRSKI